MNIQKIIDHVSNKEQMWRAVFCCFYLQQKNLFKDLYLRLTKNGRHFDVDPRKLVAFSHSIDELEQVWELVEFVDSNEQKISEELAKIMYLRPMPWVADFVDEVTKVVGYQVVKCFQISELCYLYCLALQEKSLDLEILYAKLDVKYSKIFANASLKQRQLKRNFLLLLEDYYGCVNWLTSEKSTFREIINAFLPKCGDEGIIDALKKAKTPDLRLTPGENACYGYLYYTPFVEQKNEYQDGEILEGCLFSCVEKHIQSCRDMLMELSQRVAHDENFELPQHDLTYIDPFENCLIEVRYEDNFLTNVYVEKFSGAFLVNSLSDFVGYRNGCLYTIELVDCLRDVSVFDEIFSHVNAIKQKILALEKKSHRNPEFASSGEYALKLHNLMANLNCFYYAM